MDTEIISSKQPERSERARAIIKRHESAKACRTNWDSFWQDITNFFIPDKNDVFEKFNREKGDRKHNRLYEGSAIHFSEVLANTLHSMLTNPSQVWIEFNHKNKKINQVPRVRKYLQDLAQLMIDTLNNSNFQSQIHEFYMDLVTLGTAVLGIFEDDEDIIRFDSKPIYHFYIKENPQGLVDELSYIEEMDMDKAFEKFGEEAFGEEAQRIKEGKKKDLKILHYIMPRPRAERNGFGPKSKPFMSIYIYVDKEIILKEDGYNEFPFIVSRWMKLTDEMYGRSPAMKALPDVKMLNQIMKTTIRGAQKIVDPPLMVPDDGLLGRVNTRPGGLIPYRAGTEDRVFPLETRSQPNIGVDIMQDVRERVSKHFFIDQIQLREGPQMTATEVNARVDINLRQLGPILGRQTYEFLQRMIARNLQIMIRKGEIPEDVPPELQEEFDLDVFFTSQIAKAQRASEAQDLVDFLAVLQPIIELDPSASDVVDIDETIRKIANLRGVTEDIFRTEEEIQELRDARAEQEAKAQQTQQELAGAEVLNKAAPAAQQLGLVGG